MKMVTTHNFGFPRIGGKRELKFALEKYWRREISKDSLLQAGLELRQQNWQSQSGLDFVPVGDFSFYDQVLDTSFMLGNVPSRISDLGLNQKEDELDNYFRVARGVRGLMNRVVLVSPQVK